MASKVTYFYVNLKEIKQLAIYKPQANMTCMCMKFTSRKLVFAFVQQTRKQNTSNK